MMILGTEEKITVLLIITKILPNTGKNITIYGSIALVVILGIIGTIKYYKIRDVK